MTDDEIAAIKARHEAVEVMARTTTPPLRLVIEVAAQAHDDRGALLAEVERLTADAAALREVLSRIEVKQPDDAGCVWLLLSSGTDHAALAVGKHNRIAAKAAIAFETARRAALESGQ